MTTMEVRMLCATNAICRHIQDEMISRKFEDVTQLPGRDMSGDHFGRKEYVSYDDALKETNEVCSKFKGQIKNVTITEIKEA